MMNTRCTKLSMVRDDAKSSKTSNKKCPVVLHGDHDHNHISLPIFWLLTSLPPPQSQGSISMYSGRMMEAVRRLQAGTLLK